MKCDVFATYVNGRYDHLDHLLQLRLRDDIENPGNANFADVEGHFLEKKSSTVGRKAFTRASIIA
jgi:hypothetical protein